MIGFFFLWVGDRGIMIAQDGNFCDVVWKSGATVNCRIVEVTKVGHVAEIHVGDVVMRGG